MRYCQACGIAVPERSVYCPACGTLLATVPGEVATAPVPGPPDVPPTSPPPEPSPAPARPRAPSGRTLGIVLGGIGLVAVVVVGAWVLAGQGGGTATPSGQAGGPSSVEPATPAPAGTPIETLGAPAETPIPTPEPTEPPVPTEAPTPTLPPSPGIPAIIGETPVEAVGAFLVQRGVQFAGICASVDPATAPEGAYCADLVEERLAEQVWRAGPVASEADVWLLVDLTEMGWAVSDYAPLDDPSRPPF